ncbi:DUF3413 domain-containing protein [Klebsiella pneumoniae]
MLLAMVLGSRYLFVADWPTTLAGRLFSYVSLVGHFSFLVFTSYVLILFPLTFIVVLAAPDALPVGDPLPPPG